VLTWAKHCTISSSMDSGSPPVRSSAAKARWEPMKAPTMAPPMISGAIEPGGYPRRRPASVLNRSPADSIAR
jgi:hypothetical protein